jgi:hypothetical protein
MKTPNVLLDSLTDVVFADLGLRSESKRLTIKRALASRLEAWNTERELFDREVENYSTPYVGAREPDADRVWTIVLTSGRTIADVARAMGVSRQAAHAQLARPWTYAVARRWAEALNVGTDELVDLTQRLDP